MNGRDFFGPARMTPIFFHPAMGSGMIDWHEGSRPALKAGIPLPESLARTVDMVNDPQLVTRLLHEWRGGNLQALDELTPLVYDELRRLASRCLYAERPDHTLRATALVHEAYMRMLGANVSGRTGLTSTLWPRILRRILVEYARKSNREKHGGAVKKVELDEAIVVGPEAADIVVELDQALDRLAKHDERKSEIVQLLYFGGMTYDETADALGISPATVHREMKLAKAWLFREMVQGPA